MSQAREFGWRLLAAETIFHSYDSSKYGAPSVIRFDEPVNVREINILSPSMYMRTSSGGFLIGGTDPIKFPVTFHCNNVDEDTASANVKLGELNYEEDASMTLRCDNEIWTNRLIVFAKYSTLTIVVYGTSKNYNAKEHLKNLSPIQRMGAKYADQTYAFVRNFPSESKL